MQNFSGYLRQYLPLSAPSRVVQSAWAGHIPFAQWLVSALRPRFFVELGVHNGTSYCTFCHAVKELNLSTACFGIDTWKGDARTGHYSSEVFADLEEYHQHHYSAFSRLITSTFDEALSHFADGSIDLLHIDGVHTYEVVRHDFETWQPKLADSAAVLFHDINVREHDFGAWKLWTELKSRFPHFEFHHGHGLGLLAVGPQVPATLLPLLNATEDQKVLTRNVFASLGRPYETIIQQGENQARSDQAKTQLEKALEEEKTNRNSLKEISLLQRAIQLREMEIVKVTQELEKSERQRLFQSIALPSFLERNLFRMLPGFLKSKFRRRAEQRDIRFLRHADGFDSALYLVRNPDLINSGMDSATHYVLHGEIEGRVPAADCKINRQQAQLYRESFFNGSLFAAYLRKQEPGADIEFEEDIEPHYENRVRVNSQWFANSQITQDTLLAMARRTWPSHRPFFSIVMPIWNTRKRWLAESIQSVMRQNYDNWELICVNDASTDPTVSETLNTWKNLSPRIRVIENKQNQGISRSTNLAIKTAKGDYILFLDHDDLLEPQALYRFADAILSEQPDLIYADEVITSEDDSNEIIEVVPRPQFSYDYYLSHPYFVHPIAIRRQLVDQVGGIDESFKISQDIDFILRILEKARVITHVPEILYRWRRVSTSHGHHQMEKVTEATSGALQNHLHRIGFKEGSVKPGPTFNTYQVQFHQPLPERVAIIIPTKDRMDLLRRCVNSLLSTIPSGVDIVIVDHESREPETLAYFSTLPKGCRVIRYSGVFNYSEINNYAVRAIRGNYDYYLFLNNDVMALEKGWLESMLDLARRKDVAIVGATLIYPYETLQHAGVIVGMRGVAEHAHKETGYYFDENTKVRNPGPNSSLVSNRDYSAVTAACMLVRAEVFDKVGGFDEAFAVGFGDTDFCLRVLDLDLKYRILQCAYAVLVHEESATRGISQSDNHPEDTHLFRTRYRKLIQAGDPFFSLLFTKKQARFTLDEDYRVPLESRFRTVRNFLPRP